jgi:hypothetical protein
MSEPVVYKQCPKCLFEKRRAIYDEITRHRECPIKTKKEYSDLLDKAELDSLFPAQLRIWNRLCPAHHDKLWSDARTIVSNRFIPVDWFDVFDAEGNHVCRACGAKLLTKKGKPHHMLRWCQGKTDEQHEKWRAETFLNFANERIQYIHELAEKQIPLIREHHAALIEKYRLRLFESNGSSSHWVYGSNSVVVMCEKCGVLCTDDNFHSGSGDIRNAQVHHKNPVCHVNETNIMSIFDHANFECLCTSCHGQSHPWRKRPVPPEPKYKTLEAYIK